MVDVAKWVDSAIGRPSASGTSADDSKRANLVVAAVESIEASGPSAGMADIARRAGIARPHVYRHFASKEQLDSEVARFAATELVRRVRPTMVRSGTPTEIVRGVIAESVGWAAEHPNLYRFLAARQQTKSIHRARFGRTRFLGEVVDAATAYLRASNIHHDVPDGILAGLMGMVDASIIWWLDQKDEEEDQVVDRLTRQVWQILHDMLAQLGLEIPDGTVLRLP